MVLSDVAQIRGQIAAEYMAAKWGLSGLASGTPRHDFIEARMDRDLERFLQLAKEGKIEQIDREVDLMQRELKSKENEQIVLCHIMTSQ